MKELISFLVVILASAAFSAIERYIKKRNEKPATPHRPTAYAPMPMAMPANKPPRPAASAYESIFNEGQRVTDDVESTTDPQPSTPAAYDAELETHREKWRQAFIAHEVLTTKFNQQ